ncbi:MAG: YqjK family protein [Gammaproteobacteria bacterium]|nr:hypothetical protein [Gammaproteobacteria bacterium]
MSSTPRADRAAELAERRRQLQAKCAAQRQQVARAAGEIGHELAKVDRALGTVRRFVKKPVLIAVGVAVLTLIGPARLARWMGRSVVWYGLAKRTLNALAMLRQARS